MASGFFDGLPPRRDLPAREASRSDEPDLSDAEIDELTALSRMALLDARQRGTRPLPPVPRGDRRRVAKR